MSKLLDAFWRAAMYCLHPRVIALSILPLVIMTAISLVVGYFFWNNALELVRANLESLALVNSLIVWLEGLGLNRLRGVLAPVVVLVFSLPVIVIASLLFAPARGIVWDWGRRRRQRAAAVGSPGPAMLLPATDPRSTSANKKDDEL